MLLRSSSTPVLGSLISSISESPGNNHNHHHHQAELHGGASKHAPSPVHQNCGRISCGNGRSQSFSKSLIGSPSVSEFKVSGGNGTPLKGFRRVQSEGNLEELDNASSYSNADEFSFSNHYSKKFARNTNRSSLEPIPSFSINRLGTAYEDEDDDDDSDEEENVKDEECEELEGEEENGDSFRVDNLISEDVRKSFRDYGSFGFDEGKMYLAAGIGVLGFFDGGGDGGIGGGGGGGSYRPVAFDKDGGGDNRGVGIEEHYKKMLEANPGNPLFLRNYAQFLYQTKGDLRGAEEYYSRAILADPEDGEILSQYAKLIWELHHDKERAENYFRRAVQASSEDSHIHAAYASFLWDIEDDEDNEENAADSIRLGQPLFNLGIMASVTV